MKTICDTLEVARSNIIEQVRQEKKARGRYNMSEDAELLPRIREITDGRPSYGYRRTLALLNRRLMTEGKPRVNHKRVYRIMRQNNLLLEKHTGHKPKRTHDGEVITLKSNLRWCSDGFEIRCWSGEKVRVAFSLDCCDREIMSYVATTRGISAEMIRDLMTHSLEARFGTVDELPHPIEWLTDNGSCYTATETVEFGESLGLLICTTPVSSPESNGMAESFVKTFKRDYVYLHDRPDAKTVLQRLPEWFEDYNEIHPHKGLKMQSPREFRRAVSAQVG